MKKIYFKILKKVFKKNFFRIYHLNKAIKFKTKNFKEIIKMNRNDCYEYFLFHFNFKCEKFVYNHRYFFKNNKRGFGEDAFHSMWRFLLLEFKPLNILEIGVYRGQVISLLALISREFNLKNNIWGLSPLTNDSDQVSKYDDLDYQIDIENNFKKFNLGKPNLFKALSTDEKAISFIESKVWNLIYVDGSHDYEVVISDVNNSINNLSENGILVIDDSSLHTEFNLKIEGVEIFKGHPGPSKVLNSLMKDDRVEYLFGVGHNNIFLKK